MERSKEFFEEVARVAYELYEQRGMCHGCDVDDWLAAERVVMERYAGEIEKEARKIKAGREMKKPGASGTRAARTKAKPAGRKKTATASEAEAPKRRRTPPKKTE